MYERSVVGSSARGSAVAPDPPDSAERADAPPQTCSEDSPEAQRGRLVVRGAVVNLLGYVAGFLDPLFLVVVTRLLGASTLGSYVLAATYVSMLMRLVVFGLDRGLLRHIPLAGYHAAPAEMQERVLGTALRWTLAISLIAAGAVYLLADTLVQSSGEDPSGAAAPWLAGMVLSAPAQALKTFLLFALRARSNMLAFVLVQNVGTNLLLFLLAIPPIALGAGARALIPAYVAAHYLSCLAALIWFRRDYSDLRVGRVVRARRDRALLAFSFPQGLTEFLNLLLTRADIIMIGILLPKQRALVAVYAVAALVAGVVKKVRQSFDTSLSPVLAGLIAHGHQEELDRTYRRVSRWIFTLYLLLALVLSVGAPIILALFGRTYVAYWSLVPILVAGHLANAAVGVSATALLMAGRSKLELANNAGANLLNVALNLCFIPLWGIYGAAFATTIAFSAINLARAFQVRRLLATGPDLPGTAKLALAGGLAVAPCALLLACAPGQFWAHAVALVLLLPAFLLALRLTGQKDELGRLLATLRRARDSRQARGGENGSRNAG